jgi:hypothetical protein
MRKAWLALVWLSIPLFAQNNQGELRLKITDPGGLALQCEIQLSSQANQYRQTFQTDATGALAVRRLPYGLYQLEVRRQGFATHSQLVEIRSALAIEIKVQLRVEALTESVTVTADTTLVDPRESGNMNRVGQAAIENRPASLPGRSLQDLVNSQPGWLYEGNAVLHPRGSEYQTQMIVDGVPLTDNRSPGFAPEIEADDVDSLSIYTAGFPAEYGRKLGGVVEVASKSDTAPGFHGEVSLSGGSFNTGGAYALGQYATAKNAFSVSADGDFTARYLNPPVTRNYTNAANTGDFAARYERDFDDRNHLRLSLRNGVARFQIPNELLQQQTGQLQAGSESETAGTIGYQHVFSADVLGNFVGMVRDDTDLLNSNQFSTPILATQDRGFREYYLKATVAGHRRHHEWKAGAEGDFMNIHEAFADVITNPSYFDPGTPPSFRFYGLGYDREQSAFAQDLLRLGNWTLSAGLRWDRYKLIVDQNAVSPRLSLARYFPHEDFVLHVSYDRVFQTPAFENILLSSSPAVQSLDPSVLRLPVRPSLGNFYEIGWTKGLLGKLRLDANGYLRQVGNFADDNQLLNTPVSFPIAFRKASIYGAEGKIELPKWRRWSGFVSYSYMVGSAYFPVTGGLFLGDSATGALTQLGGRFWVSQDQRNTVRARVRYQVIPRLWIAGGAEYGSGLPVDFDGTEQQALAQYGQQIVDRVNFDTGRVKPSFSLDASAGTELYHRDRVRMRFQVDAQNLTNRLNVIDFAGLFSGNSVAPPRSYGLRLVTQF